MMKFKLPFVVIMSFMLATLPVAAQNLTARQMNIYFGSPKKVTMSNSQGTTVVEFDQSGRITCARQGSMSISYEWNESGDEVTLSMYQGANFQDGVCVQVVENSPSRLKYIMGGEMVCDVLFKENGALDHFVMSNAQLSASTTYCYKSANDVYPSQIEQKSGDQAMVISVVINETDSYGNAIAYTQECMGNKDVARLIIEYY